MPFDFRGGLRKKLAFGKSERDTFLIENANVTIECRGSNYFVENLAATEKAKIAAYLNVRCAGLSTLHLLELIRHISE